MLPGGALPQIYAYGLRNPFRMTFTPTGQLLVGDVGDEAFEELDRVTAGGNYGWPGVEGICTSNCTGLIDPIYTYPHGTGSALTSVLVYEGAKVFIADEVQKWVKLLTCNSTFTSCGNPKNYDMNAGTDRRAGPRAWNRRPPLSADLSTGHGRAHRADEQLLVRCVTGPGVAA